MLKVVERFAEVRGASPDGARKTYVMGVAELVDRSRRPSSQQ